MRIRGTDYGDGNNDVCLAVDTINRLQQENEQLRELLRLAATDIEKCCDCDTCKNDNVDNHCGDKTCCRNCFYKNWQWQHADKLKELGVEV